jgi:hypothetical protein
MSTAEFRRDFFTLLNASIMAEREACARIAEKHQKVGQCIARRIRDRPKFKFPPITLEVKATKLEPRRRRQIR